MPVRLLLAMFVLAFACSARAAPASYLLRYDAPTRMLAIDACLADTAGSVRFVLDGGDGEGLGSFVRDSGAALEREGNAWRAPHWRAGECLHYRAALGRIATAARMRGVAMGEDVVTAPQRWLLRVEPGAGDVEVRVELPPGFAISAPWQPLPSHDRALHYRIASTPPAWLARVAIGRFAEQPLTVAGGTLRVAIVGAVTADARARLLAWLDGVARAALSAYGRLPLADVQVLVLPVPKQHEAVLFGQSTRGEGHALTLFVDPAQPPAAFARDWVAVHELAHLMHPYLGNRGAWLAEGLATYYQNVLRARAGLLSPAEAWEQLDAGFRRGRDATAANAPALGEAAAAMGASHDFQRIYWSGAAYWLDVDLRLRSAGQAGVDEALRAFAGCCLPDRTGWTPEAFVRRLDALAGTDVFASTWDRYHRRRDFPDLAPAYAALGLVRGSRGERLHVAADAPAAGVREAIMRPRVETPR
jgi:M61 glycyl aminopeptidase